ncbi:hypothetical protein CCP1ISM_110008 [Azospirillaceae bacterium]
MRADLPALSREFGGWVDALAAGGERPIGARRVVGAISQPQLDQLAARQITPESGVLTIADRDVLHMLRDAKVAAGEALGVDDLKRLPEILAAPRAVLLDRESGDLLYVFDPAAGDGRDGKLVAVLDFSTKQKSASGRRQTAVVNTIRSGGLVPRISLADQARYEVLEGGL